MLPAVLAASVEGEALEGAEDWVIDGAEKSCAALVVQDASTKAWNDVSPRTRIVIVACVIAGSLIVGGPVLTPAVVAQSYTPGVGNIW